MPVDDLRRGTDFLILAYKGEFQAISEPNKSLLRINPNLPATILNKKIGTVQ